MRFTPFFLLLLCSAAAFSQSDYRRYYGETPQLIKEFGIRLESAGDRPVVIGTRQNPANGLENLGGYVFDPVSGEAIDSFLRASNKIDFVERSWPAADGGFIVTYFQVSRTGFTPVIGRFDRNLREIWTRDGINQFSTYLNFTYDKDGTLLLLWANRGEAGRNTFGWRLDDATGDFIETVDFRGFGEDAPLHLTVLPPGAGYLLGGQSGSPGRGFLRRVDDDFNEVWVRYFDNIGNGRLLSITGSQWRADGTIRATGYVGVPFSSERAYLRLDTLGTVLSSVSVPGAANLYEQVDWYENTFFAESGIDGGNIYNLVRTDGSTATSESSYDSGRAGTIRTFRGSDYRPTVDRLLTVEDIDSGDPQMVVNSTAVATQTETTFSFGLRGNDSDETARQLLPHPNGRDWLILSSAGRPAGGLAGAQLLTIDPSDGEELAVTFPSEAPNGERRQAAWLRPDGRLQVAEVSPDDRATVSILDEELRVAEQFVLPNNRQYFYPFFGTAVGETGGYLLTEDRYNPTERQSDFRLLIYNDNNDTVATAFTASLLNAVLDHPGVGVLTAGRWLDLNRNQLVARIQNFDPTDGSLIWRWDGVEEGCASNFATDLQILPGGSTAAVTYSFGCNNTSGARITYREFSADGEEIRTIPLPSTVGSPGTPQLSPRSEDGEVAIAWGRTVGTGDGSFQMRLLRLDTGSGLLRQDTVFEDFFGRTNVVDLTYLSENRLGILAVSPQTPSDTENDILLLVTGTSRPVATRNNTLRADVTLSPNPTAGLLRVVLGGSATPVYYLRVLASDGREVARTQVQSFQHTADLVLDLQSQPPGSYRLLVTDGTGASLTRSFVIGR